MKKNKYILILAALIAIAFSSCKDDNLVFEEPISERVKQAISELEEVLTSNGGNWKMQYYTDTAYFGAYNLLFNFDNNNNVTVQGDALWEAVGIAKHTSEYAIETPQGVALVFKTYNRVLTLLADPDETEVNFNAETLGGDNEFLWHRTSENRDTVFFRTKKSKQLVHMIRYNGDWDEYLNRINRMAELYVTGTMDQYFKEIDVKGTTLLLTGYDAIRRTMNPAYITNTDSLIVQTNGMSFTETGFEFFEPLNINGKEVQNFTYNETNGVFEISDEGVTGQVNPVSTPDLEFPGNIVNEKVLREGQVWTFDNMPPEMFKLVSLIVDSIVENVPDFERYYYTALYPSGEGLNSPIFMVGFTRLNHNSLYSIYAFTQIRRSTQRSDMLTIAPYGGSLNINIDEELKYILPSIEDNFRKLAENILGDGSNPRRSYVLIPSADYRTITFGSIDNSMGFTLKYNGTLD